MRGSLQDELEELRQVDYLIVLGAQVSEDVLASVNATDNEYKRLKKCHSEDTEINGYPGLSNLCRRIISAEKDANDSNWDYCMGRINYRDASFFVYMPESIKDTVKHEEENN